MCDAAWGSAVAIADVHVHVLEVVLGRWKALAAFAMRDSGDVTYLEWDFPGIDNMKTGGCHVF